MANRDLVDFVQIALLDPELGNVVRPIGASIRTVLRLKVN